MDDFWDDLLNTWWGKILMSLALLGFAYLAFDTFSKVENGEDGGRVPWWVALAYYVGGKWVVSGLFALGGVSLGYWGIRQKITGEE